MNNNRSPSSKFSGDYDQQQRQNIPFTLPGHQIEKSIIYEIPNSKMGQSNSIFYEPSNNLAKTYKVQKQVRNNLGSEQGIMCLNCNQYVRIFEVDQHSLSHIKIV